MGVTNKKTRTKTRRHLRGLDQVKADIQDPKHLAQYKATRDNVDLPGLGQYYCVECAKWFEDDNAVTTHLKGKNHKRRVKDLKAEAYTQREAMAAVGISVDNGAPRQPYVPAQRPAPVVSQTQDVEVAMEEQEEL